MSADNREPVLFLHGQPGSAGDWDPLVSAIGDRARSIAIDRPGWDGQPPGDLAHSAAAGVAALDAVGAATAKVVGLSFGSAVAVWMALQYPDRVSSLVLISPAANQASLEPIDRLLAAPVVGYLVSAALLSGVALSMTSRRIRRYFESSFSLPEDYLRNSSHHFRRRSAWDAFVVEQRALLRDMPVLERRLSEISVPTTVLIGTADTIVPPAAGRQLATQIPGAELQEIVGGHHILPAEYPGRVADLIVAT